MFGWLKKMFTPKPVLTQVGLWRCQCGATFPMWSWVAPGESVIWKEEACVECYRCRSWTIGPAASIGEEGE